MVTSALAAICSIEVLKAGRRLVFGAAETRDEQVRLVAHSTLTYTRAA